MGHDAIDNAVANVAGVGQAALTAVPEKAVETSMKRPTRILVARVFRVQELPREDIDLAVGHLARPAIDSGDSRCFRPGRSLPPRIHNITSLNWKGSRTEPARVGLHPVHKSIFGVRGRSVTVWRHAICPRRLGSTTTAGSPPRNTPATPSCLTSSSLSQRTTIARDCCHRAHDAASTVGLGWLAVVAQPITRRGALIRTVGRDTTAPAMLFQSTTQLSPAESNMKVGLAVERWASRFSARG